MIGRWRSLLFAAADDERRIAKIAERGADAVILDLEDAVPPARKPAARAALPAIIDHLSQSGIQVIVRINGGWREACADLEAAISPGTAAIMVPKVEHASRLVVVNEMAAEISADAGLTRSPPLIALIESPLGLDNRIEIARAPNVIGLALGSEDFALALGVSPTPEALDLPCRMIALAAASQGVIALGAPISIATIADKAVWRMAMDKARAIGLTGALCIHPDQVSAANEAFRPSETEQAWAREILAAWTASGEAGVIQVQGRMIDRPVILAAQRLMARMDSDQHEAKERPIAS